MKIRKAVIAHLIAAAVIGGTAALAGYHAAQPENEPKSPSPQGMDPAQMQEAMAKYMALMRPGPQHEFLSRLAGDWDYTMRMWWEPGGPPIESKGESSMEMILDGRYLRQTASGSMAVPGPDGSMQSMPFNGVGMTGFDNFRKQFTATWADNMSTAILTMHGALSPDGKVLTMFGAMDEPMTGEIGKTIKWVTRVVDKDHHFFEAWEVSYGDAFKVFEIEYTRKK